MRRKVGGMYKTKYIYTLLQESKRKGLLHSYKNETNASLIINEAFFNDGSRRFQYSLLNGKLHGVGRLWHENGQLLEEEPWYKGIYHGRYRKWYDSGRLCEEAFFVNNEYNQRHRFWYANGNLKSECLYESNKINGLFMEWFENGMPKSSVTYVNGLRHGIEKEYDVQGKLISRKLYIRGVMLTGKTALLIKKNQLTAKKIMTMKNAAVRRICLEEMGYERFLMNVDHSVIDHNEKGDLIKICWHKNEEPLMVVKVRCPSTGAFYTLRVPPHMRTAPEAIAWTFGLQEQDYQPIEET